MSNGLVRKVIVPLIIGIPLIFGGCSPKQKYQEVKQISNEHLYKQGVVLEDSVTKGVENIKVTKRSITGSRTEIKPPVESIYGYYLTVLSGNRKWVLFPSWPGPGGSPVDQEVLDKYNKEFKKKLEEMYDNIKPGDEIKFIVGRRDTWSNGNKNETFFYEEPKNGGDIEYPIYTNAENLEQDIQKVK